PAEPRGCIRALLPPICLGAVQQGRVLRLGRRRQNQCGIGGCIPRLELGNALKVARVCHHRGGLLDGIQGRSHTKGCKSKGKGNVGQLALARFQWPACQTLGPRRCQGRQLSKEPVWVLSVLSETGLGERQFRWYCEGALLSCRLQVSDMCSDGLCSVPQSRK